MKSFKLSLFAIALIVLVVSCKKNDAGIAATPISTGLFILNQGIYGQNNTSLTYYDFGTTVAATDYYFNVNNVSLGAAGSDFIVYGSKMYIVMNTSGNVTVTSLKAKLISTVSFINTGINKGPENIVGYGSNVFVSSTDGTVAVIDTTSLTIIKEIKVGANPAQMIVAGNNLYVSNTGAFSSNYDSTLSIINLSTLTQTSKIKVGINPGPIAADNAGNLYIVCSGNYTSINPSLVKVNTSSNSVILSTDTIVSSIRYYNNLLYVTPGYGSSINTIRTLSTTDFSTVTANIISDGSVITSPYGLDIDPSNGAVYIADAKDYKSAGAVFCFDQTGHKKFSFSVAPGINPSKVVPIHQ